MSVLIIAQTPVLETEPLNQSETALRRAHHVLTFLLAFYAHTSPRPTEEELEAHTPLVIPASLGVPLVSVSSQLRIAPVVTYADTVLWNWAPESPGLGPLLSAPSVNLLSPPASKSSRALRCLTLFSGTSDETHFYLTSARIELAGARALGAMERTLDELFVGDSLAPARIARHLRSLAETIHECADLLTNMRDGCEPSVFYNDVRPWFRGGESWPGGGGWVFEGVPAGPDAERARWSIGASAGQSTLVHAFDGQFDLISDATDKYSFFPEFLGTANTASPYLQRMQGYMPRHHRAFLAHLRSRPPEHSLSALIARPDAPRPVVEAYNACVEALRRFRDTHLGIAGRYVVNQARRSAPDTKAPAMGTGGTDLVPFLKNLRDNTSRAVIPLD